MQHGPGEADRGTGRYDVNVITELRNWESEPRAVATGAVSGDNPRLQLAHTKSPLATASGSDSLIITKLLRESS